MSKYDDEEVIAQITWQISDLRVALKNRGYTDSDENIEKVLANRFETTLEDRGVDDGWEMIDIIIGDTDGLEKENEQEIL